MVTTAHLQCYTVPMMLHETQPIYQPGAVYRIRIEGHLDQTRAEWFDGLEITLLDEGETLLSGRLPDQSALFGVLKKIHNLGLLLVSLERL